MLEDSSLAPPAPDGTDAEGVRLHPRRQLVVAVPSIAEPIQPSPGFEKKLLSTHKLDIMGLCGFGCAYCSSNEGNYLRTRRQPFAALTEAQLGERLLPAETPELAFTWPDVIENLEAQIAKHPTTWGQGKTLVFSMLTDAFSGPPLRDGTTERALRLVLERTSFRVRVLTKNSVVGLSKKWQRLLTTHRDRVVVGLSVGSLDAKWAKRVEAGTPPPAARLRAHRAVQDAGVPTFGMLCPIFPDVLEGDRLDQLVDEIRPERCEHVWAEPYNDRNNWRAVRAGYAEGSYGWRWFTEVHEGRDKAAWSRYATDLYIRLRDKARHDGWVDKLRYLLYEANITDEDAGRFGGGLQGVLLQSPKAEDGRSKHATFRLLE